MPYRKQTQHNNFRTPQSVQSYQVTAQFTNCLISIQDINSTNLGDTFRTDTSVAELARRGPHTKETKLSFLASKAYLQTIKNKSTTLK